MFAGGAASPALKPAHSLLPLPGQTHCASAEKQHGVSPFLDVLRERDISTLHTDIYLVNIYPNIIPQISFI